MLSSGECEDLFVELFRIHSTWVHASVQNNCDRQLLEMWHQNGINNKEKLLQIISLINVEVQLQKQRYQVRELQELEILSGSPWPLVW